MASFMSEDAFKKDRGFCRGQLIEVIGGSLYRITDAEDGLLTLRKLFWYERFWMLLRRLLRWRRR